MAQLVIEISLKTKSKGINLLRVCALFLETGFPAGPNPRFASFSAGHLPVFRLRKKVCTWDAKQIYRASEKVHTWATITIQNVDGVAKHL